MSVVGDLVTELNALREENRILRWRLEHPHSTIEQMPVFKVGEEAMWDEFMRKVDLLITLVKRNGS